MESSDRAPVYTSLRAGIGWLSGTLQGDGKGLCSALSPWFGSAEERDGGIRWYRRAAELGTDGALVAWEPRGSDNLAGECMVSAPQSALDALGSDRARDLLVALKLAGCRYSRVDLYLDDLAHRVRPPAVREAFAAGDVVSRLKRWDWWSNAEGGATLYLGSRQSDVFIRVYRKDVESGDPGAGVRWEVQSRAGRAEGVAGVLGAGGDVGEAVRAVLAGLVDFREGARAAEHGEGWKDARPRLWWWEELVGGTDGVGIAPPAPERTIARKRAWIDAQVAPTIGLLDLVSAPGWLARVARRGQARLTERDLELAAESAWE